MPDDLLTLECLAPVGFPRVEDYFGIWAMEDKAFSGLFTEIARADVRQHVAENLAATRDRSSDSQPAYEVRDGVALISLSGTLMPAVSSFSSGTSTIRARQQIRDAVANADVGSIMLVIDSPGGTVAGTDQLAEEVRNANMKKPVFAQIENLGASAAYYVASQASKISMNRAGVAGSIGVFSTVVDYSGAAAEDRIKVHVIRAGQFKGAGTPGTEITAEQLQEFQARINAQYELFLSAVSSGRSMSVDKVRELATGSVYTGQGAVDVGLVDSIRSLDETFAVARATAQKTMSPKKGMKMSDEAPAAPVAATLEQLEAACPGAPSDFLMAQLKAKATVEAATKAFTAKLVADQNALAQKLAEQEEKARAEKAAADAALAAKEKELADAKKLPSAPGVDPVRAAVDPKSADDEDAPAGSAKEEFDSEIRAVMEKKNVTRYEAMGIVARKNPQLHQRFLMETNSKRRQRVLLEDKLESYGVAVN